MLKLRAWVLGHSAEDIHRAHHQDKTIYTIDMNATIGTCLAIFRQHRIHHLLVKDEGLKVDNYRWLNLATLLRSLAFDLCSMDHNIPSSILFPLTFIHPQQTIYDLSSYWNIEAIGDWSLSSSSMVPLALKMDNELIGILTMRDVLHYVYLYGYHLNYLMERPIDQIILSPLPSLFPKESTAEYCRKALLSEDIIGIIDSKGRLLASVTITAFANEEEEDLDLPILEYLVHVSGLTRYEWQPVQFVNVQGRLTFGDLLKRLLQSPAHHYLWKLGDTGSPIGIIGIWQLLRFIRQQIDIKLL